MKKDRRGINPQPRFEAADPSNHGLQSPRLNSAGTGTPGPNRIYLMSTVSKGIVNEQRTNRTEEL